LFPMPSQSPDATVANALKSCQTVCMQALQALMQRPYLSGAGGDAGPSHPDISTLRADFISLLSFIYEHTTRVGMSFKPPITPSAAVRSLGELTRDVDRLASCALTFPTSAGKTLTKGFIWAAQEVVESVQTLASGLLESLSYVTVKDDYLRRVGQVHAAVEKAKVSVPLSQISAVEKLWVSNSEAINDASEECKMLTEKCDAMEDDDEVEWDDGLFEPDDRPALNVVELERINQVFVLLRLTAALHQKLIQYYVKCGSLSGTALEARVELSSSLTASVDELVASLHAPQDVQAVESKVQDVVRFAKTVETDLRVDGMANASGRLSIQGTDRGSTERTKHEKWFETCLVQIEKAAKPLLP